MIYFILFCTEWFNKRTITTQGCLNKDIDFYLYCMASLVLLFFFLACVYVCTVLIALVLILSCYYSNYLSDRTVFDVTCCYVILYTCCM